MKKAIVLKPFPYAHDGMHVRTMEKGEVFDCQDDVFDGLVGDKLIKAARADVEDVGNTEPLV